MTPRALSGGRAPHAWRRHMTRSLRWVEDLDRGCRWTRHLAQVDVVIVEGPLTGATLAQLVGSPGADAAPSHDAGGRRGTRGRRAGEPPAAPGRVPPHRGAEAAASATPARPGPAGLSTSAGPPAHGSRPPAAARFPDGRSPAGTVTAMPAHAAEAVLRRLAGTVPSGLGDRSPAAASRPRRSRPAHLPPGDAGRWLRQRAESLARRLSAPASPGAGGPASAGAGAPGSPGANAAHHGRAGRPAPAAGSPGSVPAGLVEALAGAARELRRGPTAPSRLLDRLRSAAPASDRRSPREASHRPPPGDATPARPFPSPASRARQQMPTATEAGEHGTSAASGAPGPPLERPRTAAVPALPPPPAATTSAAPRAPSVFPEFPASADRERSSAPWARGSPDVARADGAGPPPLPDLERAMKRVLDDAARRHGIEV